ncbi:formyltransferase family protein [Synechococcus sp. GEYO]|uniref:formyltransferase family protein n=1 Tax=Synechococcus sp. GEYO TaxID=2575511 RepID=UPI000E0F9D5E|nr:formyltransferase family protein [Synechococcus sp. GEYO]
MLGLLSTIDHPLLPFQLKVLREVGIKDIVVFLDQKTFSSKNWAIWNRRTNGYFNPARSLERSFSSNKYGKLPFYFVESHTSDDAINLYSSLDIQMLYNAGTPRKLTQAVIDSIPFGILNVHPGKLPEYRGCSCVEWAILNDDKIYNTVHLMDADYDSGPVLNSECYEFEKQSSYCDIRNTIYSRGCQLAAISLSKIQNGQIISNDATVQNEKVAKLWGPMPKELEQEAIQKANDGLYRYQL